MRVLVTTYGSRGDVQPMIALTVALRNLGVEVAMCVPPDAEFVKLLERYEIQLIPAFASVRDWVDRARQSGMRLPQLAGVPRAIPGSICRGERLRCDRCDRLTAVRCGCASGRRDSKCPFL